MSGKRIGKDDVWGRAEENSEVMAYLMRRISCETGSYGRQWRPNVEEWSMMLSKIGLYPLGEEDIGDLLKTGGLMGSRSKQKLEA
jgi:hypothetical protein